MLRAKFVHRSGFRGASESRNLIDFILRLIRLKDCLPLNNSSSSLLITFKKLSLWHSLVFLAFLLQINQELIILPSSSSSADANFLCAVCVRQSFPCFLLIPINAWKTFDQCLWGWWPSYVNIFKNKIIEEIAGNF